MKSKTSFFSLTLYINDLKKHGWFGIIYTLFLFFVMPLYILLNGFSENYSSYYISNILEFDTSIINFTLLLLPVLVAIILFRYLQVVKAYTTVHSYPYTRIQIFNSHILAGMTLLIAPLLINTLLLMGLSVIVNSPHHLKYIEWLLQSTLISTTVFVISSFIGVVVGISFWHFVFSYIFMLLPYGIYIMAVTYLEQLVFGFTYQNMIRDYSFLSPLLLEVQDIRYYITCLVYCIVFYGFALYLYNRRNLENASKIISIKHLNGVFKYGVTFCFMLLGGIIYNFRNNGTLTNFTIGAIIGTVIGYFASEMLLQKRWRVFNKYKGLVVYAIVMGLVLLGIRFDITGFEKRIPKVDDIEYVSLCTDADYKIINSEVDKSYKTEENIIAISNLHSKIVSDRNLGNNHISINYYLKNGKKILRYYRVDTTYDTYLAPIYQSYESRYNHYGLLRKNEEDIHNVVIEPDFLNNTVIKNPSDLNMFIHLIKKDIINESYNSIKLSNGIASLRFNGTDNQGKNFTVNAELKLSYEKSIQWLKDKGYYKDIVMQPEDVVKIAVVTEDDYYMNSYTEGTFFNTAQDDILYIEDKGQIKEILDNQSYNYNTHFREIIIYVKHDKTTLQYIQVYVHKDKVPQFITDFIRERKIN